MFKSLFLRDQPLRLKLSTDPRLCAWSRAFLGECIEEKARHDTLLKHRLAAYSQRVLDEVVRTENLEHDRSRRGILLFHRSQQSLDVGLERMLLLESDGQKIEVLDRKAVAALEPNLTSADIAGGIFCLSDEAGDPAKFTRGLVAKVSARGIRIRNGVTILGVEISGDKVTGIATDKGVMAADAYVLVLGSESPLIAREIAAQPAGLSCEGLFADLSGR